jgi:broad specificity phosphatase PhoE
MTAILLRHGQPDKPYDDYGRLTLEELDELSLQHVDPPINTAAALQQIAKLKADILSGVTPTIIYHSPSLRAKESAELLAKSLGTDQLVPMTFLHEILFSPKQLITQNEYSQSGMNAIRTAVFHGVTHGGLPESPGEIVSRVDEVEKLIRKHTSDTVIIVTHGFFMRLLQARLQKGKKSFSIEDQSRAVNYSNLDGFLTV